MFKPFLAALSFLTIIPMPRSYSYDLNAIARNMHFFPLYGGIIGFIVGLIALFPSMFLPHYIASFTVLVTFVILTGIHHIDALADFADGLMAKGDKESKRRAMSDPIVGSAGASALIINFIGLFIAVSGFNSTPKLFFAIIASEIMAKYVMVMQASVGDSAWYGSSSPFTIEMKKSKKIFVSTAIAFVLIFIIEGGVGLLIFGIVVIIGFIIYVVSCRNFGGVSGDVFGASNEIARLSSLLILSSLEI